MKTAYSTIGLTLQKWTVMLGGFENNWLMMVKTKNTDSARDDAFNDWYNSVDIPDVLEVPGYMRARRGQGQNTEEISATEFHPDEGHYVALYDIKTRDMDKTIIDMLMANWGMEKALCTGWGKAGGLWKYPRWPPFQEKCSRLVECRKVVLF